MSVVKKPQSNPNITKKKQESKPLIQSVREPSIISEMGDTNFGELDETKDGLIVAYDAVSNKFILKTTDQLLVSAAEDVDLPEEFLKSLENELELGTQIDNLDGGEF